MDTTRTISGAAPAVPHRIPVSIRILRRLEPVIAAVLASPVHGLLSRDVLLLSYSGRRSGRRYTLPLSYVERNGSLYLCTRPEGSQWWRNLKNGAEVELRLRGRRLRASAAVLEADSTEALDGLRTFVSRNPRTGVLLYHVARDGGSPCESDLVREVRSSVVVRLTSTV